MKHDEMALNIYNWNPRGDYRENEAKTLFKEIVATIT